MYCTSETVYYFLIIVTHVGFSVAASGGRNKDAAYTATTEVSKCCNQTVGLAGGMLVRSYSCGPIRQQLIAEDDDLK